MPFKIFPKIEEKIISKIHIHDFLARESPALYISHMVKTFAQSLIGLYIPIYIFNLYYAPIFTGNTITDGIILVLTFYLIRSITAIFAITSLTNLIFGKLNFKRSIFIGNVFLAIALFLLSFAADTPIFLYLAAVAFAIDTIFYWIPYHLLFIRKASSADGHYGKSFSKRLVLGYAASAAGPIVGGFIIAFLGFQYLFIAGIGLILISSLPISIWVNDTVHGKHNAFSIFRNYLSRKRFESDSIAITAVEMDALLYAVFWPILMFTIAQSYSKIGIISSISIIIASLMALVVGNLVDKNGPKTIHKIGSTLNALLYLPKVFITTITGVYIIDILDRINSNLYHVPFNAVMYEHARDKTNDSDFIIYRATIMHIAAAVICIFAIILLHILPSWKWMFFVTAIISPLAYMINDKSK